MLRPSNRHRRGKLDTEAKNLNRMAVRHPLVPDNGACR